MLIEGCKLCEAQIFEKVMSRMRVPSKPTMPAEYAAGYMRHVFIANTEASACCLSTEQQED